VAIPQIADDEKAEEIRQEARPERDQCRQKLGVAPMREILRQADVENEQGDRHRNHPVTEGQEPRVRIFFCHRFG